MTSLYYPYVHYNINIFYVDEDDDVSDMSSRLASPCGGAVTYDVETVLCVMAYGSNIRYCLIK